MNALQISKAIFECQDTLTTFNGLKQRLLAQGVHEDSLVIQATNEVLEHGKERMTHLQKQLHHVVTHEASFVRLVGE